MPFLFKYEVDEHVHVKARTWPGINKHGGFGKVKRRRLNEQNNPVYDIKLVLGGSERGVEEIFISSRNIFNNCKPRVSKRRDFYSETTLVQNPCGSKPELISRRVCGTRKRGKENRINAGNSATRHGNLKEVSVERKTLTSLLSESLNVEDEKRKNPKKDQTQSKARKHVSQTSGTDKPKVIISASSGVKRSGDTSHLFDICSASNLTKNKKTLVVEKQNKTEIENQCHKDKKNGTNKNSQDLLICKSRCFPEKLINLTKPDSMFYQAAASKELVPNLSKRKRIYANSDELDQQNTVFNEPKKFKKPTRSIKKSEDDVRKKLDFTSKLIPPPNINKSGIELLLNKYKAPKVSFVLLFAKHKQEYISLRRLFQQHLQEEYTERYNPHKSNSFKLLYRLNTTYRFCNFDLQQTRKVVNSMDYRVTKNHFRSLFSALAARQTAERQLLLSGKLKFNSQKKIFECFKSYWPIKI